MVGGVEGQRHTPAPLPQERALVPTVQEVGWAPGRVWTSAEERKSLAPIGVRTRTVQPVASRYILINKQTYKHSLLFYNLLSIQNFVFCTFALWYNYVM